MADKLPQDPVAMQKQLSQMWEMLDDLAIQDPESYQKFIQSNLAQGADIFAKPKPEVCIRTVFNTTSRYLYVNIFSWGQITAPKSREDNIPMLSSKLKELQMGTSDLLVIAIAINPKIFEECSETHERKQLFKLILTFIKETRDLDIELEYSRLKATTKGDPNISSKWLYEASFPTNFAKESTFTQPLPSDENIDTDSIIGQLTNLCTKEKYFASSEAKEIQKKLIEEIPEKEIPLYVTEIAKIANGEVLKLCITLPGVSTVSELDIKISRNTLNLSNAQYELNVKLKQEIDEENVKMEFDKTKHFLRISALCIVKDAKQ